MDDVNEEWKEYFPSGNVNGNGDAKSKNNNNLQRGQRTVVQNNHRAS